MLYVDTQAGSKGVMATVHYNALMNYEKESQARTKLSEVSDALLVLSQVCSATDRPIKSISDIYFPPNRVNSILDSRGIPQTDKVVRSQLFTADSGYT